MINYFFVTGDKSNLSSRICYISVELIQQREGSFIPIVLMQDNVISYRFFAPIRKRTIVHQKRQVHCAER